MAKRGRPSSASLVSFPGVTDTPPRFTPPSFLTNAEQSLFSEIVNGTDARHFVEADTPLIVSFVKSHFARPRRSGPVRRGIRGMGESCSRAGHVGDQASSFAANPARRENRETA